MISSPFSESEITEIRDLFPCLSDGRIYMNHAAISPLPTPVFKATSNCLEVRNSGPIENFEEGMQIVEDARQRIASYINADSPDQITFMGNTSDAISAVAEGLSWSEGDEIILNTLEFPSNIQPFRRLEKKGVNLVYAEASGHRVEPADIENLITPKTKLVSISAVQYLSGFRADIKAIGELCNRYDILFVVDGIQALGATPIDVTSCKIDALCTGAHKWLMAPMGIGFLYLSNEIEPQLEPVKTGWLSVEDPWELSKFEKSWLPVNQHLETGTPNLVGISGIGASLKLFDDIGIDAIRRQILYLSGFILSQLESRDDVEVITQPGQHQRMGIVAFSIKTNPDLDAVISRLKENNCTLSAREGYVRISPHFYNTEQEVEQVFNRLFSSL